MAALSPGPGPSAVSTRDANGAPALPESPPPASIEASAPRIPAVPVGIYPEMAVVDTTSGLVYVINDGSNNVSVINGSRVVATLAVGMTPVPAVYDSADGYVYVPNYNSNNVSVLNGTSVVASVRLGSNPYNAAYDPGDGEVYIPEFSGSVVAVLNGTKLVASVTVGSGPQSAAYDAANGYLYIPNWNSNTVSILNGTRVIATPGVGVNPESPVYDPANGYIYVTNDGGSSVSVLNGTQVIATISVGSYPVGGTYDPADGFVYVPNELSNSVSVLNGTRLLRTVGAGGEPETAEYDAGDENLYVPDFSSNNVTVLNDARVVRSVSVGVGPYSAAYDGTNGILYVSNTDSNNVSLLSTWNTVTFSEMGLPNGTLWRVNTSRVDSPVTNGSSVTIPAPDGVLNYSVWTANRTWAAPSGVVSVAGLPSNVSVTFAPETYGVTFVETGLPVGTNWSVTLGGTRSSTTGTADRFVEVNGTYPEEISPIPGWRTPSPSGNVTVSGTAVRETVVWSPEVYPVEFVEKGLPTGTGWWVNVTETPSVFSAGTNVSVNETNGTYAYAVVSSDPSYSAAGGSFSVQGTGVLETLDFAVVTYAIVFSELGLPLGTTWSVVVEGSSWMSSAASITVREGNGSYGFSVPGIAGFSPSPGSGTVTVVGASVNQTVLFLVVAPTTYTVTFTESGLASGSEWSVTLNGTTKSSTGAVEFPGVQNGTYRFTVEGVGRSVPTPSSGQVTINGSPVHRSVVFPGPVSAPSTLVGLTPAEGVELVTGVAAIAGVCGFIGLSARRQRRRRDRPMGRVPGPPQKGS